MIASRERTRDSVRRMPSSTAWSASVTGVRSGLLITCRSSALNRAGRQRVGVVGEHVREPQVVGVVRASLRHGAHPILIELVQLHLCRSLMSRSTGCPLHPLVVHAAVVLGPLAALARARLPASRAWRDWLRWPLLGRRASSRSSSIWAAYLTGENFQESQPDVLRRRTAPQIENHEEHADVLPHRRHRRSPSSAIGVAGWLHTRAGALRIGAAASLVGGARGR